MSNGLAIYSLDNRQRGLKLFMTLLRALVVRDILARYRRSILGPLWAILQPLILMVLFTLLRGIVDIPTDNDVPYVIFSYAALVPWTFFSNAVIQSGPSVFINSALVKKMALPREVFPAAAVATSLFDLVMAGLVLVGMMFFFQVVLTSALLWLPLLIIMTAFLAWGVGLGLAALATFKRDFIFAAPFLMQFWLYATPIIYPLSSVPEEWKSLYILNPTVGLIESFRAVLIYGQLPDFSLLAISAVGIMIICSITWPLFRLLSQYFADVL